MAQRSTFPEITTGRVPPRKAPSNTPITPYPLFTPAALLFVLRLNPRPIRGEPSANPAGKPVTEAGRQQLAEVIATSVVAGDQATPDTLVTWDSLFARVTAGVDASPETQQGFVSGLRKVQATPQSIAGSPVGAVKGRAS